MGGAKRNPSRQNKDVLPGKSFDVLIELGRTLIKLDLAFSPRQFMLSFSVEKSAECRF